MNVYTVTWTEAAQSALARLWNENPAIRGQLTTAADHLDEILKQHPKELGEPTSGSYRQAVVHPLKALFDVSDDDRKVRVIYVKYWCD